MVQPLQQLLFITKLSEWFVFFNQLKITFATPGDKFCDLNAETEAVAKNRGHFPFIIINLHFSDDDIIAQVTNNDSCAKQQITSMFYLESFEKLI